MKASFLAYAELGHESAARPWQTRVFRYGYITGLEGDGQIYTENWVIKAHRQFGIVMAGGVKMECSQSEVSRSRRLISRDSPWSCDVTCPRLLPA